MGVCCPIRGREETAGKDEGKWVGFFIGREDKTGFITSNEPRNSSAKYEPHLSSYTSPRQVQLNTSILSSTHLFHLCPTLLVHLSHTWHIFTIRHTFLSYFFAYLTLSDLPYPNLTWLNDLTQLNLTYTSNHDSLHISFHVPATCLMPRPLSTSLYYTSPFVLHPALTTSFLLSPHLNHHTTAAHHPSPPHKLSFLHHSKPFPLLLPSLFLLFCLHSYIHTLKFIHTSFICRHCSPPIPHTTRPATTQSLRGWGRGGKGGTSHLLSLSLTQVRVLQAASTPPTPSSPARRKRMKNLLQALTCFPVMIPDEYEKVARHLSFDSLICLAS